MKCLTLCILGEKLEKYFKMLSAENFTMHAEHYAAAVL